VVARVPPGGGALGRGYQPIDTWQYCLTGVLPWHSSGCAAGKRRLLAGQEETLSDRRLPTITATSLVTYMHGPMQPGLSSTRSVDKEIGQLGEPGCVRWLVWLTMA
jgi:hypothetical protein